MLPVTCCSRQRSTHRRIGRTAPNANALIAAIAAVNSLVLVTPNAQDRHELVGLLVGNWFDRSAEAKR
jgi:predicted nucleic acid-binding protein